MVDMRKLEDLLRVFPRRHFESVLKPDHPFLLHGPDALVGGQGRLFAFFVPHANERGSPANLLSRLALSRLALPIQTLTVLLFVESQIRTEALAQVHGQFDRVLPLDTTLPRGFWDAEPAPVGQGPARARALAYARMAYILRRVERLDRLRAATSRRATREREAMVRTSAQEAAFEPSFLGPVRTAEFARWTGMDDRPPAGVVEREHGGLFANWSSSDRHGSRLNSLLKAGVHSDYTLDRGLVYPRAERLHDVAERLPVHLLVVDAVPRSAWDPRRRLRATALAGWFPIVVPTQAELAAQEKRVQEWRRRADVRT